jgi:hypothetical protein
VEPGQGDSRVSEGGVGASELQEAAGAHRIIECKCMLASLHSWCDASSDRPGSPDPSTLGLFVQLGS